MAAKKHSHKKTYYNDIALRLAHRLLGVEHLHYGYFDKKLKPTLANLPEAQEAYVKNLVSYIPKKGISRVFDVGCGTGGVATRLVKKKYNVTCLAPDPYLIEKTREITEDRVETITDLYENVQDRVEESYDLILQAESVQYIKMEEGWDQNRRFLRKGGYVLASDFFIIQELDDPHLSKSGHPLEEFISIAESRGFKLIKKVDITEHVAPTMDIYQWVILERVFPVAEAIFEVLKRRYPLVYNTLKVFLEKSVLKLKSKYTRQDSSTFRKYKAYMILLFEKIE